MQDFIFFLKEGWRHIISWNALDHLLFILALCAIYQINQYKQLLILVTAFTIGHSVTLALSVYRVVKINDAWVEFLIPCTIIITAIFNLRFTNHQPKTLQLNYFFALFFGLIHGLGYANSIRFMLAKNQSFGLSLFGFNIGLELGQIVVVAFILVLSFLIINKLKLHRKWWIYILSTLAFCVALSMAINRFP